MKATQEGKILAALQAGKTLTPLEALRRFGCLRLGARVHDLRRAGYPIVAKLVAVRRADGGICRIARYSLGQRA